jgi:hypothetical protein
MMVELLGRSFREAVDEKIGDGDGGTVVRFIRVFNEF